MKGYISINIINSIQAKAEEELSKLPKDKWFGKGEDVVREVELKAIIATCKEAKGEKE